MTPPNLPIAVRGYPLSAEPKPTKRSKRRAKSVPRQIRFLIFDTETTTDESQRLLFGVYQFCELSDDQSTLVCREEGIFYADDLEEFDPEGFESLSRYVEMHAADTAPDCPDAIKFMSRAEFVKNRFHKLGYEAKAMIIGFNLPFDISRIAVYCGDARGRFRGGFSFVMSQYRNKKANKLRENQYQRRILINPLDSKKAFIEFDKPSPLATADTRRGNGARRGSHDHFRGHFLDLRALTFALTGASHSLASACEVFGAEHQKAETETYGVITENFIDYARRDVLASRGLFEKLREEFDRHPIALDPCKAYSPASIAKAYLREMGLKKPSEKFSSLPPEILGYAMSAFYGGRAEVRIRRTIAPIAYTDFLSMYSTVQVLMRIEQLLHASSLEVVDATSEVQDFLDRVTVDDLFRQDTWAKLKAFVEIVPDDDILPTRAKYNGNEYSLGVNHLTSDKPLWYALPDLVASKILTGKTPRIARAFRLVPKGTQRGLKPIRLRGSVEVDPRKQNLFKSVIEERKRNERDESLSKAERARNSRFAKTFGSAGSYGINVEMIRNPLPKGKNKLVSICGREGLFESTVQAIEDPGAFCFPPIASLITSAARLMLALLERVVTDQGGTYVFADTDSMAIVSNASGGFIPCEGGLFELPDGRSAIQALSWKIVDEIVNRFEQLNPYDRDAVPGSILEIERINYDPKTGKQREINVFAISAKRYAPFTIDCNGRPIVIDGECSEHGLGQFLNPAKPESNSREWIRTSWQQIIEEAMGIETCELEWRGNPAIMRAPVSTPVIRDRFDHVNRGKPYAEQVKPFNFLLSATVRSHHWPPEAAKEGGFHLLSPFTKKPAEWLRAKWTDLHSGRVYSMKANGLSNPVEIRAQTFGDVLEYYRYHEEPKSADADGNPSGKQTVGLLGRLHVRGEIIRHIGKESNLLEDQEHGTVEHDPQTVFRTEGELESLRTWLGRASVAPCARVVVASS